jgi:hypothetical protein
MDNFGGAIFNASAAPDTGIVINDHPPSVVRNGIDRTNAFTLFTEGAAA